MSHRTIIFSAAILLAVSCGKQEAKPNNTVKQDTPQACPVMFSENQTCVSLVWEKGPSRETESVFTLTFKSATSNKLAPLNIKAVLFTKCCMKRKDIVLTQVSEGVYRSQFLEFFPGMDYDIEVWSQNQKKAFSVPNEDK